MNNKQRFIHDNRKLRAMMDVTFTEIYAYIRSGDTTATGQSTFDERQKEVNDNKQKLARSGALRPFFDALHDADRQLMSAEGHLRRNKGDKFKNDLVATIAKLRECRRVIMDEKPKHSGKIRVMFDKLEVIMGNLETQARETHTAAEHKIVKDRDMQHVSAIREVVTALRTQVEDYVSTGEEQTWDVGVLDRRDKSGKHTLLALLTDFDTKISAAKPKLRATVSWPAVKRLMADYVQNIDDMLEDGQKLSDRTTKDHVREVLLVLKDSADVLIRQVPTKNQNLVQYNLNELHKSIVGLIADVKNNTSTAPVAKFRLSPFHSEDIESVIAAYLILLRDFKSASADTTREKNKVERQVKAVLKIQDKLIQEVKRESQNHRDDGNSRLNKWVQLLKGSLSKPKGYLFKLKSFNKADYYTNATDLSDIIGKIDVAVRHFGKTIRAAQNAAPFNWDNMKRGPDNKKRWIEP